jgi:dTDP-4-dehydrorhamnose reductase
MERWLITGASGFLGSNLGFWLTGKVETLGVSRSLPISALFNVVAAIDLSRGIEDFATLVHEWRPDIVVNTAALADVRVCEEHLDRARAINVDAARDIARICATSGTRLIHISTDAVFDGHRGGYSEVDTPNPFSAYGASKLEGEEAVACEDPTAVIARTNFFGWSPSSTRSILEFFVQRLGSGSPAQGFTDFTVTSLYAQHLAKLIHLISGTDYSGVLHVASADPLSKFDFAREVAGTFNFDANLIEAVAGGTGPDGRSRSRDLSLSTSRLRALLRTDLPTQADGIRAAYRDKALRETLAQE